MYLISYRQFSMQTSLYSIPALNNTHYYSHLETRSFFCSLSMIVGWVNVLWRKYQTMSSPYLRLSVSIHVNKPYWTVKIYLLNYLQYFSPPELCQPQCILIEIIWSESLYCLLYQQSILNFYSLYRPDLSFDMKLKGG